MYGLKEIARDLLDGKLPKGAGVDLAKARILVCSKCPHFGPMSRQCGLCGCFVDLKVKLLDAECPAGKW